SGWLALGNNNLTINNNGAITGFNASNWIRTNGTGTLRRTVQNNKTPVLFPIGSDGYTPVQVTFTLASTTDVIGARVFSGVLANGTAGSNLSSSMVNRSWVIDETVAGGSTATVSLQWADTMEIGGFNRTNCGVSFYRSTPPSWMAPATYGPATGSNPFTVTRSGVALSTTPTAFAVGDNLANSTLPVQLTKLVANKAGEDVIVNWSTASEFNNSHFEVERSFNGADFELAGKVDGVGFTNSESNYNFVDEKAALNPTAQVIYYRLKQVDFDGKHTFYGPVAVNINKLVANVNVSVYPNPFNQQVNVQVVSPEAGTMQISITDLQGRAVYTGTHEVNKGLQVISLDGIDTLKDGVYFMNSNINGSVSRVKLVKAGN
ncbi:MAG: T9SS type A sorting domain-containing protein, partial [Bacteroidota bacterium]